MQMTMTRQVRLVLMVCFILASCSSTRPPVTKDVLIGSYTYVSNDPSNKATDHNLDHLVLLSDGRYHLVEGGTTKPVSEKEGSWSIVASDPPNLLLDHAGYPVKIEGNEIRLLVDLDVGMWWVKSK
jgi:hypothetical protein